MAFSSQESINEFFIVNKTKYNTEQGQTQSLTIEGNK